LWNLGPVKFPWNDLVIGAIGHIVFLVFGYLGSLMFPREHNAASEMTFWTWLRDRKRQSIQVATI
jgi:hypothetical protein